MLSPVAENIAANRPQTQICAAKINFGQICLRRFFYLVSCGGIVRRQDLKLSVSSASKLTITSISISKQLLCT